MLFHPPAALPDERIEKIRNRIDAQGRVLSADLAREFQTSEDTIRRDLRDLAAAGLCRRVYGGALRVSPASRPLAERLTQHPTAKAALGRAAAALIQTGQIVFIDTGSTNLAIAQALPDDLACTIVTNAPSVAAALIRKPQCIVVMIGGQVDPKTGGSFGGRALRDLDGMRPDLCFVGTCALSRDHGLAVFDAEEAVFKRRIVEFSTGVVAAVTTDKLSTSAPFAFAAVAALDVLVLEADATFADAEAFPDLRTVHAASDAEF